ncbi:MAG: CdaR family protein [Thermaerobacter sp.]|nr:CdaR family protein [Thermaerobacter sp.]
MMDRLLENNTVLKILAVIVAIFIWVQARPTSINHLVSSVAVGFSTPKPHLTVLSISPSTVQVNITGPPSSVNTSTISSDVTASINLSTITHPGTYSMKVSAAVPGGVTVSGVTPQRVTVVIAKIGQQRVPVAIQTKGQAAAGDELSGYKSDINQATISGPVGALNQVHSVEGTLSIAGRSGSFSASVVLHPINANGQVVPKVQVNPASTRVRVSIKPKPPEKVLPVIAQLSGKPALGYAVAQISVYPSSVTITGSKKTLAGLGHIDTIPISVAGGKKAITVSVPVVVPKGATLVSSGEVTVTVTISRAG